MAHILNRVCCLFLIFLSASLVSSCDGDDATTGRLPGVTEIEMLLVANSNTGAATFHSHNQNVVSNSRGIFMTYILSANDDFTAQHWQLIHSKDGGQSFEVLIDEIAGTNPPVLETDAFDNIYLARPEFSLVDAELFKLQSVNDYAMPSMSVTLPGGKFGKYAMAIDEVDQHIHYFSANGVLNSVDLQSTEVLNRAVINGGAVPPQYALINMGPSGNLHLAWTTQEFNDPFTPYWSVQHMMSSNGGEDWKTLSNDPLTLPVIGDNNGPTDLIANINAEDRSTWLASMLEKNGKLHFVIQIGGNESEGIVDKQRYVRYDLTSAQIDAQMYPEFKGEQISFRFSDGFFVTDSNQPTSPLYVVMNEASRLACLVSYDNGVNWEDYAVGPNMTSPFAVSGSREITSDGYIIGSVTDLNSTGGGEVYFFKIKAFQ